MIILYILITQGEADRIKEILELKELYKEINIKHIVLENVQIHERGMMNTKRNLVKL